MIAKLISSLMALTAIAELAFYAFKSRDTTFILGPAFSNIGRIDHFTDLQVVTLNGASCPIPLELIYDRGCYFNQTNIPRLFIGLARLLGVNKDSTIWAGFILGTFAIAAILCAYILYLHQWRLVLATGVALSLYPFRLALERGNIDLIILIILILAGLLAAARPPTILKTSLITGLFVLGSMGKLYPLLLTPLLILNYKEVLRGRYSFLSIAIPLIIASTSFFILLPDVHAMLRESYKDVAGGLSYGLATLVEPTLGGFGLLGLKLAIIALIAASSFSSIDVFGHQSLAADVSGSLASAKTSERLGGILFIIGATLLVSTYLIFINGIYRISVPFILILPAIIHAIQISSPPEASAGKPALGHQDNAGILFLLLVLFSIGIAGYRPYATGSNLQHYTNLFLNLILIPTAVGTVGSALALVFLRQKTTNADLGGRRFTQA
jgi:hypothetical protein